MTAACSILLHLAALHLPAAPELQSFTPGAGLQCQAGPWVAAAGAYRNSEAAWSRYAAAGALPFAVGQVRAGVVVGLIDGYSSRPGFGPLAAGVVQIPAGRFSLQLLAVPRMQGLRAGAVQLAVGMTL